MGFNQEGKLKVKNVGVYKNGSFVNQNQIIDVGTYEVRVCITGQTIISWSEGYSFSMTINSLTNQSVSWEDKEYIYTGQELSKPKVTWNGKEIPSKYISVVDNKQLIDVGTYTLKAPKYLLAGGVYSDNASSYNVSFSDATLTKEISITKATNKFNLLDVKDSYYGDPLNINYESAFGSDQAKIEYYDVNDNLLNTKPTDVGTYKVKIVIEETDFYTGISDERSFSILKAQNEILRNPVLNSFDYESQEAIPTAGDFKFGNDNVIYKYFDKDDNELNFIPNEVGEYYLIAIVNETKNYAYKESEKIYFEIIKVQNSWNINPTIDSPVYSQNININLKFEAKYGDSDAKITYYQDGKLLPHVPYDVGKYIVKISFDDTRNYYGLEQTLGFEIIKAQNQWIKTTSNQQWVYKEGQLILDYKALFGTDLAQIKYFKDGVEISTPPLNVGDYIVRVLIPDDKNYFGIDFNFNVSISKANYDLSNIIFESKVISNPRKYNYQIKGDLPSSLDVKYEIYKYGELVSELKASRSYQIKAIFTNNDNNYNDVQTLTINIEIAQNKLINLIIGVLSFVLVILLIAFVFSIKKNPNKFIKNSNLYK